MDWMLELPITAHPPGGREVSDAVEVEHPSTVSKSSALLECILRVSLPFVSTVSSMGIFARRLLRIQR